MLASALDERCPLPDPKLKMTVLQNGGELPWKSPCPPRRDMPGRFLPSVQRRLPIAGLPINGCSITAIRRDLAGHIGGILPIFKCRMSALALLRAGDPQYLPAIRKRSVLSAVIGSPE